MLTYPEAEKNVKAIVDWHERVPVQRPRLSITLKLLEERGQRGSAAAVLPAHDRKRQARRKPQPPPSAVIQGSAALSLRVRVLLHYPWTKPRALLLFQCSFLRRKLGTW